MAGGPRPGGDAPGGILDLLRLASDRPREAQAKAHAILAAGPAPYEASVAHQAIGMLHREFGELGAATAELSTAVRLARASGSAEREADVLATLGVTLTYRGHSRRGLAALDRSLALAGGEAAARVLVRRGIALWVLGRHAEALEDLGRSIRVLRAAGDNLFEARARTARALVHLARGAGHLAERDLARAEHLYATTSQTVEVAFTRHNRGLVAYRSGDLPAALACLDEAGHRYRQLAVPLLELATDRCAVLLAAGLPADALAEADAALGGSGRGGGRAAKRAELLLASARAALAAGEPGLAATRAQAAQRLFTAQGRRWWRTHAGLLLLQARCAGHPPSARLLRQGGQLAADLDLVGSGDAAQARLLAGQLAAALGRPAEADSHLRAAARNRYRRVTALARAQGWLAEALRADAAGDRRRLLAACGRGLAILDEHQVTLGASELRAQATAHGAELASLAQRAALRAGRPRLMLSWSERWRATAHAVPAARPADDADLQADLTALRDVTSRLDRALASGDPAGHLRREQLRLEASVRARVLRSRHRGRGGEGGWGFSPGELLGALGPATLVQIVAIDGDLHILVCNGSQVRHVRGGRADEAATEVGFARFGLHRLAHGRGAGPDGAALATLETSGRRLEAILLGPAARLLGSGPVIVVPPGRLHAVPWALLPALRDRAVSVVPSARAWLQALAVKPPDQAAPVFVRGPGLGTGTEIPALAAEYPDATVLGSGTATARRVLGALDGAGLAHIAAHGSFRADSPLFSSLRMDDGPLTVYDLERLRRAPYRVILSSCDSGVLAPAGADELLGLAHCLAPLGTAGIVASVVPVNDQATARLMTALHKHLRGGASLALALRLARDGAEDEPVQAATAWSFLALGAA
ncbi:MAG TPA: CHAT domain-containing protein [Streptosporangiaceae bacterium]|nr:CHAT domain-containing protein [Streptosporangiaceae bacterium]